MATAQTETSAAPVRLRWAINDLITKDGHRINIGFTCGVVALDEPAERKLFSEVFGNQSTVPSNAIEAHLLSAIRSSAEQVALSDQAQTLLTPGSRSQWITALKSAANEVAFACGIAVLAPFEIDLTSPTLQRERLEQMQRIAAERRSADRAEHFARATELLKQWESLKTSVPGISPGKLLEQVNPADRGLMLETLLMAGVNAQPDLWAVSGSYLVRIDFKQDSPQTQLIPLPVSCGPLRSLRSDNGKLFVGARNGVMIVDPANIPGTIIYHHRSLESEHGFTAVTPISDQIWACHREGGLVSWNKTSPETPQQIFTPSQLSGEPKNLLPAGLFTVGTQLMNLAGKTLLATDSPIAALLQDAGQIILIEESGKIRLLDAQSHEEIGSLSTTGKLSGAALLPWLSASRLLLLRGDGRIECTGLEDQLVTQFHSGNTTLRTVSACAGKVVAMSSDRQRLLVWNAWDGRKTVAEIYLTGQTHHRVADFIFG